MIAVSRLREYVSMKIDGVLVRNAGVMKSDHSRREWRAEERQRGRAVEDRLRVAL